MTVYVIAKLIPTVPGSLVGTVPHDLHRNRRAVLNPYFSKASIWKLDPVIRTSLIALFKRLDESANSSGIFHASLAYKAATCDIITGFSFGVATDYIARDDYEKSYFEAVDDHLNMAWMMTYIAWLPSDELDTTNTHGSYLSRTQTSLEYAFSTLCRWLHTAIS